MLAALTKKELREVLPLVVLGVILELALAWSATGMRLGFFEHTTGAIPFVSEQTSASFFYVSGALALALGLWQTMLESSRGTFQFLLHRPLDRRAILATKLAVGLAATLVVALLPVALYSFWAATPGTHAGPFEWSMTTWAWVECAQMPLVYLGAFLSGLRPGRWFGSRFLPLAASLAVPLAFPSASDWPWLTLAVCVAAAVWLVLVILSVGQWRDYS
jgi:hypothetical protein